MKTLDEQFRTIPDNRTGNAVQYQLPDVLKAAFAMFSLKHPSLLDFKTQSTAEENNLHNIYRIEGNIGSPVIPVVESIYCGFIQAHSAHSLRDQEINAETDDRD